MSIIRLITGVLQQSTHLLNAVVMASVIIVDRICERGNMKDNI